MSAWSRDLHMYIEQPQDMPHVAASKHKATADPDYIDKRFVDLAIFLGDEMPITRPRGGKSECESIAKMLVLAEPTNARFRELCLAVTAR